MSLKDWALQVPGRCVNLHYEATGTKRSRWFFKRSETSSVDTRETMSSVESVAVPPNTHSPCDLVDPMLSNEAFDRDRDERLRKLKWNGWGFNQTHFIYDPYGDTIQLASHKLPVQTLPNMREFLRTIGLNPMDSTKPQQRIHVPRPSQDVNQFLNKLEARTPSLYFTQDSSCRLFHSHGQTAQEIFTLRTGVITRTVDAVVYPSTEEHIMDLVNVAKETDSVLIPFGGGTSVTLALLCPRNEQRFIVSVDMSRLSELLWVDTCNMTACIQAGATGRQIESMLNDINLTLGHDPDSHEFSTLGGWIATRASGMKKNKYGNIEDIVVDVTLVTTDGMLEQGRAVSRLCSGPDLKQLILGSEGTLGIIVKAVVKVKRTPHAQEFDSILFPSIDVGIDFMRDVAAEQAQPASLRLIDNSQFQLGLAMKPEGSSAFQKLMNKTKKSLLENWYKFDLHQVAACTAVFEGTFHEIHVQRRRLNAIIKKHNGLLSGRSGGQMGYHLTFMIAYIRDFIMDCNWLGESFETSVPWSNAKTLYHDVLATIKRECAHYKTKGPPFVTGRVSQVYDECACLYFYFGFPCTGLDDPLAVYTEIEKEARVCIMKHGGSISHHHGVGKLRKHFMEDSVTAEGVKMLTSIKKSLDPQNIFGNQNLVDS
eukprot:Gregarina_sp_Pseudo_9__5738@NODE_839_length_2145_cov_45_377018_g787_i0_p1_GENE_NODE_839_length_2145_cov_45_377018_g787_i0NODE_839_length_2145_cov_45_377018_g787_i0_p1_ORF_typecomplete_len652_score114_75FADoxidase_C/PF02913_19/1_4e29FAD_binding_4/PF01565_23/7_2e28CorC_HlyC/PF03471_17/0_21_NODE_839_length_2145_cov_45_377018_g787_i0612016